MNISSVSSTSNNSYVATGSTDVSQLENQKENLQKQLQQVSASKGDEKTKAAKIKDLEAKIQQIDTQIQQKQSTKTSQVSSKQEEPLKGIESSSNKNKTNIVDSSEKSTDNIIDIYA